MNPEIATEEADFLLPVGTVTFLLTDIEGSTRLWEGGADRMSQAIVRHYELIGDLVAHHGGVRPAQQGEGDSVLAAFPRASDALSCALDIQRACRAEDWPEGVEIKIRMALHTGEADVRYEGNYFGQAVNRCARIRALAHGGQTLVSGSTHDLVLDRLPPDAALKDLGPHRLKDLARPEHIHQLCHPELENEFPPLRSLDALPNNLPLQLTSFIGREHEMAGVKRLLSETRMLTLTGSGGCGKTRLALQVGAEVVHDYRDGVWWVDLAPISDPNLVPNAVAAALSIRETPMQPLMHTLKSRLQASSLLLILDNCEHLVTACAELTHVLLASCPSVTILATSREALKVEGETPWLVPSLSLPEERRPGSVDSVSQYEAVRLFIDRAIKVRPNFSVTNDNAPAVAEVCQRLDGIPLAIELAAARARVLTPDQIAEGLHDRFRLLSGGARTGLPRQHTLEASVDWSYNLLDESERALLRRLSAFAGRFTLDAAEAVCSADDVERYRVLDVLSQLIDKSLVQVDDEERAARYRLLETIRHYARRKLADSADAEEVRHRHLDFYLSLAARAEKGMEGGDMMAWERVLELELDNLRAAMDWSIAAGSADKAQVLASSLMLFWLPHSYLSEARSRLDAALALSGSDAVARARALVAASWISLPQGDVASVWSFAQEALATGREIKDDRIVGRALTLLGYAATFITPEESPSLFDEAIEVLERADDPMALVFALNGRGVMSNQAGDFDAAGRFLRRALSVSRETGEPFGECHALTWLAWGHCLQGDLELAQELAVQSHGRAEAIRDLYFEIMSDSIRGFTAGLSGDYASAERLLQKSAAAARDVANNPFLVAVSLGWRGAVELGRGDIETAVSCSQEALVLARAMDAKWLLAWSLSSVAFAAFSRGEKDEARQHLDAALEAAEQSGSPWVVGRVLETSAKLARIDGDLGRSEELYHEALRRLMALGVKLHAVNCLEALGGVAACLESFVEAARLFGTCDKLRSDYNYPRPPIDQPTYDVDLSTIRAGLSVESFERAWEEGAGLSLDEAVAYVSKARGARKRPSTGWASLTPMELKVARLVAEGLTSPQIGERLFISRRTVQAHLAHIFAKLGISTRSELAAEATRRGL